MTTLYNIFGGPRPTVNRSSSKNRTSAQLTNALQQCVKRPIRNNIPSAARARNPLKTRSVSVERNNSQHRPDPNVISKQKIANKPSKPPNTKCLPHAHAPDGAEFHQSRSRFVQCRNQTVQTDVTYSDEQEDPPTIDFEADFQTTLHIDETPKESTRPDTVETKKSTERTVPKRKPVRNKWSRIKEVVKEIDPDCPPGHVMLTEEERTSMLEKLQESYSRDVKELNKLPICVDTLRVRTKKIELEQNLILTEKNIKVFSKPKVYVQVDKD